MLRVLSFCVAVFLFAAVVQADESRLKPMPWHLVDLWWDIGADRPFESYSIDMTIHDDVTPDVNLYIAPVGIAHLSGTPFYGGLQTQSDGNSKENRRLRKIGRGLLLSMWGERSEEAIRPAEGGFFQSSGHEGDFVSVRRPYQWTKGTYTYRVTRMEQVSIDEKPYTWVGAFLYSHERDENIFIGALRFPGEQLTLAQKTASFVEIYGRRIPLEQIPQLTVSFGNLQVNGQPVELAGASAVYPRGVPDYADTKVQDGQLVVEVGQPVEHRQQRHVKLLPIEN